VTGPLLVDIRGAAAAWGISARSFRRLVARGKAPAPVRLGRLVRWRAADLEAWIAEMNAAPRSP
jgi:excisionase family DNA binding protein